jgi:hypothetical protein
VGFGFRIEKLRGFNSVAPRAQTICGVELALPRRSFVDKNALPKDFCSETTQVRCYRAAGFDGALSMGSVLIASKRSGVSRRPDSRVAERARVEAGA